MADQAQPIIAKEEIVGGVEQFSGAEGVIGASVPASQPRIVTDSEEAASPSGSDSMQVVPMATPSPSLVECVQCGVNIHQSKAVWLNKSRCANKAKAVWKCKLCNLVQVNLYRVLAQDSDVKLAYNSLSQEDKRTWMTSHKEQCDGLISFAGVKKSLRDFVKVESSQAIVAEGTSKFHTNHDWVDEDDLRERFKTKPHLAQNIIDGGKKFWCPDTKRQLYGIPLYNSKHTESNSTRFEQKQKCETDFEQPKEKKPRTKAKALAASPGGSSAAPSGLTKPQKSKLDKLHKTSVDLVDRLEKAVEIIENPKYASEFAPSLLNKVRVAAAGATEQKRLLELVLSENWVGDITATTSEVGNQLSLHATVYDKAKAAIADAEGLEEA